MPILQYLDDNVVTGTPVPGHQLALHASHLAVATLDVQFELAGDPPIFRPINVSPLVFTQFHSLYNFFLEQLVAAIDAHSAHQ